MQLRLQAKVNGRVCTVFEITHPVPRRNFQFHKTIVFIDDELNVPIRFENYSWPTERGGKPVLEEEYTYINLKLNKGLLDSDFDSHNSHYHFQ